MIGVSTTEAGPAGCRFAELWRDAQAAVPKGLVLSDPEWRRRHRWLLGLLLLHAIAMPGFGLFVGRSMEVSAAAGLVLAGIAGLAAWERMTQLIRAALTTTGLTVAGAMLVHFSDGYIESHFHFFVAMAFIALYQDWRPFLLAFFLIVSHHGIIGMLAPMAVYSHPHAVAHPWMWAAIHGGAILAECLGLLLYWHCNEGTSAQLRASQLQFRLVVDSAPNGLLMVNQDGVIVLANTQIERMFGYDRRELLGQTIESLIPERFRAQHPTHRHGFFQSPQPAPWGPGESCMAGIKTVRNSPLSSD